MERLPWDYMGLPLDHSGQRDFIQRGQGDVCHAAYYFYFLFPLIIFVYSFLLLYPEHLDCFGFNKIQLEMISVQEMIIKKVRGCCHRKGRRWRKVEREWEKRNNYKKRLRVGEVGELLLKKTHFSLMKRRKLQVEVANFFLPMCLSLDCSRA